MPWQVLISDRAVQDIDSAYLYLSGTRGPDRSGAWVRELHETLRGLADFPGPLAWPIDEVQTERRGIEVRRYLFLGSKQNRVRPGYHILYAVRRLASPDEPGTVMVLRITHALAADAAVSAEP